MIEFGLLTVDYRFPATPAQNPDRIPRLIGHLAWQWDYVREGRMRIFSPSGAFDVLPGESVISPSQIPHNFHWYEDSVASSVHFFWPEAPSAPLDQLIHIGKNDLDAATLELFFRHAPYSDAVERHNAACAFHLVLWKFFREAFPETHAPVTMKEKVRRLIEERGYTSLGVEELAAEFGMSVNHFTRRFKAETGTTPGRYVLGCRLDRAAELLRFSDMNITAVAYSLGFADLYTFSKAFRRHTGLSPRIWIQECSSASTAW